MKKKAVVIILMSIFLIFGLVGRILAGATPVEIAEWRNNFQASNSFDTSQSTIQWVRGLVSLRKTGNNYSTSGVLWTGEIVFHQDIYSLILDGVYDKPADTAIIPFASFDGGLKVYPLVLGYAYYPEERPRRVRLIINLATNNPLVSPKLYEIYLRAELKDRSEGAAGRRDNQRVSDLKRTRNLVQKYYNDFKVYPIINIGKDNKKDQWRLLSDVLNSASTTYRKSYNYGFVSQPAGVDEEYKYGYLTDSIGFKFLLWTQLEDPNSTNFKDAWQGEMFAINCSAPTYCLSSAPSRPNGSSGSSSTTPSQIPSGQSGQIQTAISFIKGKNDPRIWLQVGNQRTWLRDADIFQTVGGVWKSVVTTPNIEQISLLKFIKGETDPNIYLVGSSGLKRVMPDMTVVGFYGQTSEVVNVEDKILRALPDNYLIKVQGTTKIYLLSEFKRRWITSPSVLKKLGFKFSQVVEIDPRELDYYIETEPIL